MTASPMRAGPARNLLTRILEVPGLADRVQSLDAPTLARLIDHIGLEDAAEIVSLATTEQLSSVFDEDLWNANKPGHAESFDPERFALWLAVLMESGEEYVATKLASLPEDLVTLGLQRTVLVLDMDELAVEMAGRHVEVDLVEKALESCLYEEIDAYRIIARRHEHWDAIVSVLLALDQNHHAWLMRLLETCCFASMEYIEENGGLCDVLSADEMLESDASASRDERRGKQGYVAPTDAASFLGLARVSKLEDVVRGDGRDPVSKAYFRELDRTVRPIEASSVHSTAQAAFTGWLREAGIAEAPPTPLLSAGPAPDRLPFRTIMTTLASMGSELYARRLEELAYLSNVLMSGSSFAGRQFRPVEAAEAAMATCNLGLERVLEADLRSAEEVVHGRTADALFLVGWHILFWDVAMGMAKRIRKLLPSHNSAVDSAIREGKPWRVVRALGDSGLSGEDIAVARHLVDRFPVLPQPLCVPARAHEFIATKSQLAAAKRFIRSVRSGAS